MRIVAGRFKGRGLSAPRGAQTRPTSDRLRQALFNILEHGGVPLKGTRVLDLFAGTGALGLEALSRGASFALFVEEGREGRASIRANIEALGLEGATKVFRRDAANLGTMPPGAGGPFDLVFLDPPYGQGLVAPALQGLRAGGWLAPKALCVIEMRADEPLTLPEGFAESERRRYGDTQVIFVRTTSRRGQEHSAR